MDAADFVCFGADISRVQHFRVQSPGPGSSSRILCTIITKSTIEHQLKENYKIYKPVAENDSMHLQLPFYATDIWCAADHISSFSKCFHGVL